LLDRRLAYLRQRGARPFAAVAMYWRGRALRQLGQVEAAREQQAEARAEAEAMGMRWVLWEILAELADLAAERGDADQVAALRRQAGEVIAAIVERTPAELRAGFLAREAVRRVWDEAPAR
jgi:hypothetical protein